MYTKGTSIPNAIRSTCYSDFTSIIFTFVAAHFWWDHYFILLHVREQDKARTHEYHIILFRCSQTWWSCQESSRWHQIWDFHNSLQLWGTSTFHSNCWFIPPEVILVCVCWGGYCGYTTNCSSVFPVELVHNNREMAQTKEIVSTWIALILLMFGPIFPWIALILLLLDSFCYSQFQRRRWHVTRVKFPCVSDGTKYEYLLVSKQWRIN